MLYLCRTLSTEKGMKIHRTEMKCLDNSKDQQQRSVQADQMSGNHGQIQNHITREIHASDPDEEFRQILNAKSQKIAMGCMYAQHPQYCSSYVWKLSSEQQREVRVQQSLAVDVTCRP
ncbi:reverse transcriptase [Plakobranchus ocellatus]|uniref:Reverse transcriptase n=1 Tax=Plakobranchus ocellatus TaxID=259542 RepID=A0AAV3YM19_9GAST|nr:reverse transcriptase [Plakobranchus ocellatus]